jgi:hypothetical protein
MAIYTLQNSIVTKRGRRVYFESWTSPIAHKSISIGSRIQHLRKEGSWDIRFMSTSIQLDIVKRWDTTRWKELTLSEDCLEDKTMFTASHENHCRSLYWEMQEGYIKSALSYVP